MKGSIVISDSTTTIKEDTTTTTNFFPYDKYRAGQREILETIHHLNRGQALVLQAATGSGKTIATLAGLLDQKSSGEKIVVFVKTINQINPLLREWQEIARYKEKQQGNQNPIRNMTILPLLGKHRVCRLQHQVGKATIINCTDSQIALPNWKRVKLRDRLQRWNHRSRLLHWINWQMLKDNLISVDSFTSIVQTRQNCVYETILSLLHDADIIVTTYAYMQADLLEKLCVAAKITRRQLLVCVDEAHNLAFRFPIELQRSMLLQFQARVETVPLFSEFEKLMRGVRLVQLGELINKYQREIDEIRALLNSIIQLNTIPEIVSIQDLSQEILVFINQMGDDPVLATSDKLVIPQVDPTILLGSLQECKIRVFQSATINPIKGFIQLYQLPKDTMILDLVESDRRVLWNRSNEFRAFYNAAISSLSRFRNTELFQRYAKLIVELVEICPNHSLILTPSYEFSEELLATINENYPHLNCILERAKTSNKELHNSIMTETTKSVIIGNQRGKILEGNEWTKHGQSIVSLVIFAGLFTELPLKEEHLLIELRNKVLENRRLAYDFQHLIPAVIRAKQSLGRTIRSKEEKGALIILDDRVDGIFQQNVQLLRYSRFLELKTDLVKFFK